MTIGQLKSQGKDVRFVYRQHKGQLGLNMSCDALRIDDQAAGYIVLGGGSVALAELRKYLDGLTHKAYAYSICEKHHLR